MGTTGWSTAAYLARAGKKVLVLEQRHVLGGASVTEEIYPGFKFTVFSYVVSLLRPEIIRDLELHKHGLTILPLESTLSPLPDGNYLYRDGDHYRSMRDIARFSRRDADAYEDYSHTMYFMAKAVKPILGLVPPDPTSLNPAELGRLLRLARQYLTPGRIPAAHPGAPDDDELGRFRRALVRIGAAEGHALRQRDHRHFPGTALAGYRLRVAAPLHGRDRRLVPRLGLRQGRHRRHLRLDRPAPPSRLAPRSAPMPAWRG